MYLRTLWRYTNAVIIIIIISSSSSSISIIVFRDFDLDLMSDLHTRQRYVEDVRADEQ